MVIQNIFPYSEKWCHLKAHTVQDPVGTGRAASVKQGQRHMQFINLNHMLERGKFLVEEHLNPSNLSKRLPYLFEISVACCSICFLQTRQSSGIL